MRNSTDPHDVERGDSTRQFFDDFAALNNELSTAQRELAKSNAELRKSNSQKNLFLGMVAHDLRNPLGVVRAYSEFLDESARDRLTEEERSFLATIYRVSDFMLSIVNDLLDLAKIESGKIELSLRPLDFVPLLNKSIELNRVLARRKDISISLEVTDETSTLLSEVLLDENKIIQVFNNLLGNATKYSHRGGTIDVSLKADGQWLYLAVRDHGVGIREEDLVSILDPFKTARLRGESGEKSTGLGLAIVKRIVDAHAGKLEITSELGQGSEFVVSLPRHRK